MDGRYSSSLSILSGFYMEPFIVALGNYPGIRHIGIGDIWRRFLAKCILSVAGPSTVQRMHADQTNYMRRSICRYWRRYPQHVTTLGGIIRSPNIRLSSFFVDARNSFNELNRINMLWTIWHEWRTGARIRFTYTIAIVTTEHFYVVLRIEIYVPFIRRKVSPTQGGPLSMFAYGVCCVVYG